MSSALGAGFGADMLQQVLKRKLLEQQQIQQARQFEAKLAEEARQSNQRNDVERGTLALGNRRTDEDARQFNEQAPIRSANVAHLGASTEALNRAPIEAEKQRSFASGESEKTRSFQGGQGDLNRGNALRIANIRSTATDAAPIKILTVDEQGNPVTKFMSRSDATGQSFATPEKAPTRMSPAIAQAVGQADASIHQLDKLEQMLPRIANKIGPLAGRASAAAQSIPGMAVDKDMAAFLAESATLRNATIKAITGAQMSEPEAKRIMSQIPSETDKPEVWAQKARSTRDNITFLRGRISDIYGMQGGPQQGGGDAAAKAAELLKKYGGG